VQAADYAKFRPRYPIELFDYLSDIAPDNKIAWDCATGSGQAAVALASKFRRVIATDASEKQIRNAEQHERVDYRVAPAEKSGIESDTIDIVTVAQALHWFDLDAFYAEAKRVLKPKGVLAVWGYNLLQIAPKIDDAINRFYHEIVGPYWPPERKLIERGYAHLPFPFAKLRPPQFRMKARWSLDQLLGYLGTWSATQRFIAENQTDPVALIALDFRDVWGESQQVRLVTWPLTIRVGRVLD
jgi:SAM-dependent methyltransferase